ncbi:hypothetical protein J2S40_003515 [Nocardioides luteus]|nr:hypothetical protein [Nocardioides luteus]
MSRGRSRHRLAGLNQPEHPLVEPPEPLGGGVSRPTQSLT